MAKYLNYKYHELLGQGSFGKVFRGLKVDTGEVVALKVVNKKDMMAHTTKTRGLEILRSELEIHGRLDHQNIIKLIDYYESERELVLVTECAKCSLAELIRPNRNLTSDRVQKIACEITSALFYLHTERILHRDLKPENVLVGYDDITKLCDFGFAKAMSLDTFLLTSYKGTPLYMAPEIIRCQPYDYKTDLWSFGCILYEMIVGFPPYKAHLIFELATMIKKPIHWDSRITGDCLKFLKGLLHPESRKRLGWPELLNHPYISDGVVYKKEDIGEYALTKALSPSQEFAKEVQRRKKAQDIRNVVILRAKAVQEKQRLLRLNAQANGNHRLYHQNFMLLRNGRNQRLPASIDRNGKVIDSIKKLQIDPASGPDELQSKLLASDDSDSSLDTLTSSSDGDESEDENATIIVASASSGGGADSKNDLMQDPWIAGTRLALEIPGDDDPREIEEEWLDYLQKNIKEVIKNPENLCEKYSFRLIVQPLRNQHTSVQVIEKIAILLSLPFSLEISKKPAYMKTLENVYLDSKVVANLLYATKLIVIRRRLEMARSVEFSQIPDLLSKEDIAAMSKCLNLVSYLLHSEQRFVIQFCDSILGFQAYVLFQLFLRLDVKKCQLTSDALSILCHLMRTLPANVSILEDILLEAELAEKIKSFSAVLENSGEELWRLLIHSDAAIQSRALRIVGYLVVHSEKAKSIFVSKNAAKFWSILRGASTQGEPCVLAAAEFVAETVRHLGSPASFSNPNKQLQQSSLPLF